ncbi:MAG: hypothetical protein P8M03_07435 [Flavobacteriaceae bacterium]|nr:hypothetical protein [Flavobacteriaceae bacterium]
MVFLKIKRKLLFNFLLLYGAILSYSQNINSYSINSNFDSVNNVLDITQEIIFYNNDLNKLNEIYLNDWSYSYSSTETPLAQRLAEEYDRSFYFSKKSKRGTTIINRISNNINEELKWERLKDQKDIIKIHLKKSIQNKDSVLLKFNYSVKIPDSKFTGYGIRDKNNIYLKDWFISICPIINSKWILNSNLNLEEVSRLPSNYKIIWTLPSSFSIQSNMIKKTVNTINSSKEVVFIGNKLKDVQFHLLTQSKYKNIKINKSIFISNLNTLNLTNKQVLKNYKQIDSFITSKLGPFPHKKMLLSKIEYNKNPNYGLTLLPRYLSPYKDSFYHELTVLKVYLTHYLNERLLIDPRLNYWVFEGVLTYFIINYVDTFYPEQKFLGKVLKIPLIKTLIKNYNLSKMSYNDGFLESYEFMLRMNNHQSAITSKDKLMKFNSEISSPAQIGVGLKFLEEYIGLEEIQNSIKNLLDKKIDRNQIKKVFSDSIDKNINWFFDNFLYKRNSIDFKIEKIYKNKNSIDLILNEKNNLPIPFKIGLIKNDSIIYSKWYDSINENIYSFNNINPDYVAINPGINFPEKNHRNNWKKLSNKFNWKSIDFKFVKDLDNPKKNQLFYNPITDFNAYDGLILGFRIHNKTFKNKPTSLNLLPLYSTLEKTFVGTFKGSYNFFRENNSNYLTNITMSGSSYHYENNLRYSVFRPSLNFLFRTPDFRSNIRQLFSFSWLKVFRDKSLLIKTNPDYSIGIFDYLYSNKGAIKYNTFNSQIQFSDLFSKISLTYEYRKILKDARQISIRVFAGKFIKYSNSINSNFFDFSLNRPSDYLFEYNYLGRSENSGVYSQQFIMSEGGFKSKFKNPSSNTYMLTANLGISLWKWIELYVDFGVADNKNYSVKAYYDSGFRFNFLPDFLEFYFPIHSSENQIEFTNGNYFSNIRFVITLEPKTLLGLFNRKWF